MKIILFEVTLVVLLLLFNALACVSLFTVEIYSDFLVVKEDTPKKTESGYPIIILPTPAPNEIYEMDGLPVW